ncbi:MAG: DUF6034 family protein [Agathobacter sp.]|nr:DUF6034 family protein [Agathobacter sp.]
MRKNIWTSLFLTGALALGLLTGCSNKKVIYDIDHTQSTQSGMKSDGGFGLAQFADAETWKESWKATNAAGDTYDISISADISVPEVDQMSVVEVKEAEMDEAFKKQIIEGLFPEETVYNNDADHWPKERVQQQIEKLEEELKQMKQNKESFDEEDYNQSIKALDDEIKKYTAQLSSAPSDYQPVEEYRGSSYLIEHDGIFYRIEFDETNYGAFCMKTVHMEPDDYQTLCPDELKEKDWHWYEGEESTEENKCSLTKQEAQAVAERALSAMNLTDMVLEETLPLVWGGNISGDDGIGIENEKVTDGWKFSYGMGIEGVSFRQYGTENDYRFDEFYESMAKGEDYMYSMNSGIALSIMDEGVIGMELCCPIEITSVTKDVELLSMENIQTIMRNELTEHIDQYPSLESVNYYTNMELIYFRIRDEEKKGYYSYVPVWRLSVQFEDEDGNQQMERAVLVNAIDGGVIYLQDEF